MNRDINISFKKIRVEELENDHDLRNFFYTEPAEALSEIELRRSESNFKITELYPKSHELDSLAQNKVLGYIHRDITPNLEISRMIDTCDFMGVHPILLNYENDIFSCLSRPKYLLGRMGFFQGYGKSGGMKIDFKKIIDFKNVEGKKMNDVQTIFDNNLIDFHKKLFNERFHFLSKSEFDVTKVSSHTKALEIYKFLFFLSIKNGFLLENFVFSGIEQKFVSEIVYPAFLYVWNQTGYKPIIVPFEPMDNDNGDFWCYYYSNIKDIIEDKYKVKL